jgi:hypothetical protein
MGRLCTEVRGRGWTLSVQRWRAVPVPPLSSNLGVATLSLFGRRAGISRVAVRLAEGEWFWIAIAARRDLAITGALADGLVLEDGILTNAGEETVWHRLRRIAGEPAEGMGRGQVPVFQGPKAAGYSVAISIGQVDQLHLCILDATDFDRHFGTRSAPSEPAVYGGWRLP